MPKRDIADLALFGGEPVFRELRHVGRPNIGDRERFIERVNEIFDRRWLTNDGPCVQEFEARLAAVCDVPYCVAVCNATVGLELAIRALGLTGEVIVPSFTFVATAHALQWQEITPVFCDIDPATHTIDPARVEALITPRTTAIIGVHVWGRACDVDALAAIADRHGLKLLFDAAHAFGSSHGDRMIGGFGDAEVFSFHATKFLNSFEGGAITTRSKPLYDRLRNMCNFGFASLDNVTSIGTNGKMNEISAAMGLTSLERMDNFIDVNRRNMEAYQRALDPVPGLSLYRLPQNERSNHQYVVVEVDSRHSILSRDLLVEILMSEGVMARRYFFPGVHRMEPYRTIMPDVGARLPETERLVRTVMQLPTGTAIGPEDIAETGDLLAFAVANAPALLERLEPSSGLASALRLSELPEARRSAAKG